MSKTDDAPTGGRRSWWWPYKEFISMVRQTAWTAFAVRQTISPN